MMNYLVRTAKVRVFIFENVKTVRTCGYDLSNAIAIHNRYVIHCLHLEKKFISSATCWISVASLFSSQYREAYSCCRQDFGESYRDSFVTIVKRSRTSHPKKYVGCFSFRDELC